MLHLIFLYQFALYQLVSFCHFCISLYVISDQPAESNDLPSEVVNSLGGVVVNQTKQCIWTEYLDGKEGRLMEIDRRVREKVFIDYLDMVAKSSTLKLSK